MSSKLDKLTGEINDDYGELVETVLQQRIELATLRDIDAQALRLRCRIGKRLVLVKQIVGHGNFMPWVESSTDMSHRTANRCMALYEGTNGDNSPSVSNFSSMTEALNAVAPPKARESRPEVEKAECSDSKIMTAEQYRQKGAARAIGEQPDKGSEFYQLSLSPNWLTPLVILNVLRQLFPDLGLDPCCNQGPPNVEAKQHFRISDDGLQQEWYSESTYVNPPYGRLIMDFVVKLLKEFNSKRTKEALLLVPNRTDTKWMAKLDAFPRCHIKGRLKFRRESTGTEESSATFPSVAVYLGPNVEHFNRCFKALGPIYVPYFYSNIGVKLCGETPTGDSVNDSTAA